LTSVRSDATSYYLRICDAPAVAVRPPGSPLFAYTTLFRSPIAAQQTATGYEVALKLAGADQYGVWNTDSGGNWASAPLSNVSGRTAGVEAEVHTLNKHLYRALPISRPIPSQRRLI